MDVTKGFLSILLGQDFSTGYLNCPGLFYALAVFESILIRINAPEAICTLLIK